ncbi:hypothetical protein [Mucilaginibacter flavidus]|uniref:hypothetical protein n=1 Tax=Mucilaginibacter flavidus TaxID=2949309 RepID=UPI002091ED8D|nr:hypothetical protein [Mucilaginibacter flavidus]MCO5948595.1 hypothetical protein [Mucilaginibacter flavidus]
MKNALKHYEFINSQTGNIIAYLSLLVDMDEKKRTEQLEKKKAELATFDKLFIGLIYWQEKGHGILPG